MIIIFIFVSGLALGSFANVLVWRTYKQENLSSAKLKSKYSITTGRSKCFNCSHQLQTIDLIPVISWIMLHGKCRYCGVKFPDTPLAELLVPLLLVISYPFWPYSYSSEGIVLFIFWTLFVTGFVALALYDLRWYLLPNKIIFPLMYLMLLQILIQMVFFDFGFKDIVTLLFSVVIGGGIFWLLFQVSRGRWIGGGDVKLGFLIGAMLADPALSVLYIFVASLLGSISAIPLLIAGKANKNTHLPFGPFLLLSVFIVRLFGADIVNWYSSITGM